MAEIHRRKTPTVKIGQVRVGWEVPVVVQSMTNTDTADVAGTIEQVAALALAGSEIVRVTVNNEDAAAAVPHIVEGLDKRGIRVPIVGDFHYNGHLLLKKYPATAQGAGEVPDQSRQRVDGPEERRQLQDDGGVRGRESQAGADRRELGIAGSVAADAHDGREQQEGRSAAGARRDDGSDGGERAGFGEGGRALWAGTRHDYSVGQGERACAT